jgi:Ca2+-binding EF-hand superfamily protein
MKYALAIAAAAIFAGSAAFAGDKGMDKVGMEHGMDAKAMDAKVEGHFKQVDANADGQITEQELVDFVTAKAKAEFASMAGDDGVATLEEVKAHHHAKHDEMMKEHHPMDHGKMDHKKTDDDADEPANF